MTAPTYHPLAEGHFSYVAVQGEQVELKIDNQIAVFNLQTAEELIDILRGYVEDRHRCQVEWLHQDDAAEFFQFINAKDEKTKNLEADLDLMAQLRKREKGL